jgi:hypothetical protein
MSIRLFEQTIAHSEHLIRVAEEWLEMMEVEGRVYASPDEFRSSGQRWMLRSSEARERIEHMRDGIAAK